MGVQRVPLQGIGKGLMWLTNRGDDGHMLVGITPWNHMGTWVLSYLLFSSPHFHLLLLVLSHITCPTQLCFHSAPRSLTDGDSICLATTGYVALGTHSLLSPFQLFL